MTRQLISQLRLRWTEKEIKRTELAIIKKKWRSYLPKIAFDGHMFYDLRGFPINYVFCSQTFRNVDFSFSTCGPEGILSHNRIIQCRFVKSVFASSLGDFVDNCDFTEATLKDSWLRGKFTHCSFKHANMQACSGSREVFERCDFSGADLRRCELYGCQFIECNWNGASFGNGSMAGCAFIGSQPSRKQLGNTLMVDDSIGIDLS